MAVSVFFDTSVLLAGLIDFGEQSAPAQELMDLVADDAVARPGTAWHCCLEFYSVATRLPAEFRLTPDHAFQLLDREVFARMSVHDLPGTNLGAFIEVSVRDGITGGRIYDAHIAEVARIAGASVVVTDNRRHFLTALRHGLRIASPREFLSSLDRK